MTFKQATRDAAGDLATDPLEPAPVPGNTFATDGDRLYYDRGLLRPLRELGPDAQYFVAAHETAHAAGAESHGREEELRADRVAARSLARQDGELDGVLEAFEHFIEPSAGHPPNSKRVREIESEFDAESQS